ncbi:hypothetical protein F4775DRAFT_560295 [Biscogniauxia sp. FL1348]|nr:hypothetical protein F4775DRAFT_560295 [Biscogniauxia sp. FL1348]
MASNPPATHTYQVLITNEADKASAAKRRTLYLRPFLLFWLGSLAFEVGVLIISIYAFSGLRDLVPRLAWTLVFCPLGMGGAMGGLVDAFVVDRAYGGRAAHLCALLSVLVLGACNALCYHLDLVFGWFGAADSFWWWHARYPLIYAAGWANGMLLFTDAGQQKLAAWGL